MVFNDRSQFSLAFYKGAVLSCLAILLRKQPPPQRTEPKYQSAVSIVDRILAVDRLIPSYGNIISIAGLQV